ncbi:MAG: DNA-binding protein [Methanophagales archaeon ANME-1-THS]|nr:MAG: DNA-binding protein [Methanophagales archaeon ANME-1-THS]
MSKTKSPAGTGKERTSGKTVIVDTNALLIPGEFKVDIFDELTRLGYLEIIVPGVVLKELDRLRQSTGLKGKDKIAANVGYLLLRMYTDTPEQQPGDILSCRILIEEEKEAEEEEGQRDTDERIAALAVKRKAAVLTNDEILRTKLSRAGVTTVYLRGRNRLEESG